MAKQNENNKEEKQELVEEIQTVEECFIITPIGVPGSDVFDKAMGLIDAIIDPVLFEIGMKAMPANRMQDLGSINKQLIKRVIEDKLVIANLTGLNPNVMYELAVRHGARKPVIIMAEEGTRLPFDITDQRTIFYTDSYAGVEIAKADLRSKISFALNDVNPDNPIYSYLENAKLFREIGDEDPNKVLLARLNAIEDKIQSSFDKSNGSTKDSVSYFKSNKLFNKYIITCRVSHNIPNGTDDYKSIITSIIVKSNKLTSLSNGLTHSDDKIEFEIPFIPEGVLNALVNDLSLIPGIVAVSIRSTQVNIQ